MGGAACNIIIHAVVRFQSVPTSPADLSAFDAQMRVCLSNDIITQATVNDNSSEDVAKVCSTLEKTQFNQADRTFLWGILAAYTGYK